MLVRSALVLAIVVWEWGTLAAPLVAQSDLTLEVGASQIGPALGVQGEGTRFVVGGLRGSHYSIGGSGIFASVLLGRSIDATDGGSFLSGMLEGEASSRWSEVLSGSLDVRLIGYGVQKPFPYRAIAAEGGPSLHIRSRMLSAKLSGVGGVGRSRLELWRVEGGPTRLFEDDLWRIGGTAEMTVGPVTSNLGVAGGLHHTPGGTYGNLGARLVLAGSWGLAELRVDRWETPLSPETTGALTLVIPVGTVWSLRGFFGRADPDPLTLAQPGSGSGGVLIGRSLLPVTNAGFGASVPYEVVRYGEETSRVRMTVDAPKSATTVQLLGDFTLWEPVAMTFQEGLWLVEIDVRVGTHHFGFLVDDEWYVPDDAPDVVPDEWGRQSATLVIEGVEP